MTHERGPVPFVVQPNETESYWQPVPANGFVEVHVSRHRHQTVNPFPWTRSPSLGTGAKSITVVVPPQIAPRE